MNKNLSQVFLYVLIVIGLEFMGRSVHAQVSQEAVDQRESKISDKADFLKKPETVDDIFQMLQQRAEIKLKEKKRQLLLKTKISMGIFYGFETNPLNDSSNKGDHFTEEDFSLDWVPTFDKKFSADVGYRLYNQDYSEQTDLNTLDQAVSASLKFYPFESGKITFQPGVEYEWLWYPRDESSGYEDTKSFLKFKHYLGTDWSYGGKYEYSYKFYDNKFARDTNQNDLNYARTDYRNTVELSVTRNISQYSIKLRGKVYRNNSNEEYQKYYDYDSYRWYITFSGSLLKDKHYISFTPDFETKNYRRRIAVNTARADHVLEYKMDAYYTFNKNVSFSYNFSNKILNSNAASGEFKDIINQIGITVDFYWPFLH